jgi:hypothetical protein
MIFMGQNGSNDGPDSPPKHSDILLKEYDHRFAEVMTYSERYHKQTDILNVAITVLIAAGTYLLKDKSQTSSCLVPFISPQPDPYSNIWVAAFLIACAVLVFYLLSQILNSLFLIKLNGARLAAIEQKLNKLSKEDLLIWDSEAIPHFFGQPLWSSNSKGWVPPTVIIALWLLIILSFVSCGLCILAFSFVKRGFAIPYSLTIVGLFCVHLILLLRLRSAGQREMDEYFSL